MSVVVNMRAVTILWIVAIRMAVSEVRLLLDFGEDLHLAIAQS